MKLIIPPTDYKELYHSRQDKITSLNKTISGMKCRNTILENEIIRLKMDIKRLTTPKNEVKKVNIIMRIINNLNK